MPFNKVCSVEADGDIIVDKYISTQSGIQLIVAAAGGPIVHGYICVATEAHDDDGLPHTLEHLIFLGSKDYPYKGVLDLLANKNLAYGTNAWTDTDHTCYTLKTAGDEGFLNLLPIYMDHILYPTLTDAGYLTEVHHVDGEGMDSGTVYCEMQGRENSGESRVHLNLLRLMYPGKCGYKSETGGIMKNLRESTSNEKVRKYHADFYRPENVCIIIVGQVNRDNLFKCLEKFETKIVKKKSPFVRPWQDPVPPLVNTKHETVRFPTENESHGLINVAWRGPSAVNDFNTLTSISMLTEYLTDTAVAPMQREFVERPDPYCSSVGFGLIENSESCIYLGFQSVPKEKLTQVEAKLFELFKNMLDGKEPLDEKRMESVIKRKRRQILSSLESSASGFVSGAAIGYFLYGKSEEDLRSRLQTIPYLDFLLKQKPDFWLSLLKKYFVDANYVFVIGEPSKTLMEEMDKAEKDRVAAQRKALGEEGLKRKAQERIAADELNNRPPPPEILSNAKIPSVENLNFHTIQRLCNDGKCKDAEVQSTGIDKLPIRVQLDNVKTNFITARLFSNTSACLSKSERLYLPLWSEIVLESAIKRQNELIPYEKIVAELSDDTVYAYTGVGVHTSCSFQCGAYAQLLNVSIKVEIEKYEKAIVWLNEILYQTQFTPERIQVVAKRMLNDISSLKRKGYKITDTISRSLWFLENSNHWSTNMFRQQKFLQELLQRLDKSPSEVVAAMDNLRKRIGSLQNVAVHITCNLNKINKKSIIGEAWQKGFAQRFADGDLPQHKELKVVNCCELLVKGGNLPTGAVAGVGSVESAFLIQSVECLNSYAHPDTPALLVAIEYLTQSEGPMWKDVRGKGLAYGVFIQPKLSEGLLYFALFKSADLIGAYKATHELIKKHISNNNCWDEEMFQSCKGSLLFQLIDKEASVADVSFESLMCYLRQIDFEHKKQLIANIWKVSLEDVKRITAKYLAPLFDASASRCAICCHPSKVDEVVKAFKEMERKLEVVNLECDNFMCRLETAN